MFSLKK